MKFTELNLDDSLLEALAYMNFVEATPIQEKAIPIILEKRICWPAHKQVPEKQEHLCCPY